MKLLSLATLLVLQSAVVYAAPSQEPHRLQKRAGVYSWNTNELLSCATLQFNNQNAGQFGNIPVQQGSAATEETIAYITKDPSAPFRKIDKIQFRVIQTSVNPTTDPAESCGTDDWIIKVVDDAPESPNLLFSELVDPITAQPETVTGPGYRLNCKTSGVIDVTDFSTEDRGIKLTLTTTSFSSQTTQTGCGYAAQIIYIPADIYQHAPADDLMYYIGSLSDDLYTAVTQGITGITNLVYKKFPSTNGSLDPASSDPIVLVNMNSVDSPKYKIRSLKYVIHAECESGGLSATVEAKAGSLTATEWSVATPVDLSSGDILKSEINEAMIAAVTSNPVNIANQTFTVTLVPQGPHQCDVYAQFATEYLKPYQTTALTTVDFTPNEVFQCADVVASMEDFGTNKPNLVKYTVTDTLNVHQLVNLTVPEGQPAPLIGGIMYTIKAVDGQGNECSTAFSTRARWGYEPVFDWSLPSENASDGCFNVYREAAIPYVASDVKIDISQEPLMIDVVTDGGNSAQGCIYYAQFVFGPAFPYDTNTNTRLGTSDALTDLASCDTIETFSENPYNRALNLVKLAGANDPQDILSVSGEDSNGDLFQLRRFGYTVAVSGTNCPSFNVTFTANDSIVPYLSKSSDAGCASFLTYTDLAPPPTNSQTPLRFSVDPAADDTGCSYYAHVVFVKEDFVAPTTTTTITTTTTTDGETTTTTTGTDGEETSSTTTDSEETTTDAEETSDSTETDGETTTTTTSTGNRNQATTTRTVNGSGSTNLPASAGKMAGNVAAGVIAAVAAVLA